MQFWQFLPFMEVEQLNGIAHIAEEVGFEGVLLGDHAIFPEQLSSRYPYTPDGKPGFGPGTDWPDPWVAISSMAAVTQRLRFGTAVYILPLRDPFTVARSVATASRLSGGRVTLGTGAGWMREEFRLFGVDFARRGRRYDEMICVLRKLWQGGMVEHHGEFFEFASLEVTPTPSAPIPIYVGGNSPAALRRAAHLGDGWISAGSLPEEIPGVVERLRILRREAGREVEPFEIFVALGAAPDADLFRRVEDQGVTAIVHWPFSYWLGPRSALEQKRAGLEKYAESYIVPLRG
ncbi:MAG: LLM class F420-dependent oxidoreductase [Myxococcota bacterium]